MTNVTEHMLLEEKFEGLKAKIDACMEEKIGCMEISMTEMLLRKVLGKHPKDEHESSNCNERDSSGNGSNLDYHHSFGEISCASKKGGRIKKTQLDGPQRLKPILKFRASEVVKIKLEKPRFEKQRPAPCNTPRLTEMKSKGLCFRCGEKFHPLCPCAEKQLRLLILGYNEALNEDGELIAIKVAKE
ncbi:uncharacterized protein [Glycine max]|uniref:uncharacterized protein n=1 Tax=Glycine max TaxID=3847 RepID=UPI0003DE8C59|nr:uncharacterized protein LOC121173833 [Glycine max]